MLAVLLLAVRRAVLQHFVTLRLLLRAVPVAVPALPPACCCQVCLVICAGHLSVQDRWQAGLCLWLCLWALWILLKKVRGWNAAAAALRHCNCLAACCLR